MGVNVNVYDFKCFNQLRNGVDFDQNLTEFTPNLVGNVGEKVKVQYSADVTQSSFTEGAQEWVFIEIDPSIFEVTRSSGSFIDESVQIGDGFYFYDNWENRKTATAEVFRGEVLFLSNEGRTLRFSVESGTFTAGTYQNVGFSFDQSDLVSNRNDAFFIKFGLIGNEETFNFLSKTTGNQQIFYRANVPLSASFFSQAESLGVIKDWVSGSAAIGARLIANDFGAATFEITHEFIINPFYILAYRQFIENETIPELLAGDNSLKYAVELEFRKTLSNTGSSKKGVFERLDGFIGWYGENFNGLNAQYKVKSVAYEDFTTGDPYEGVNINAKTKITIVVEDPDAAITDYSCGVYLIRVPQSENDYIGTKTNLVTNFIYKSAVVSSPATSATDISTSLVSGDLVIEFDVDYLTAERLRLTEDDEFLLLVQVEDPTESAGNSDRLMMVADFKNYVDINFVNGFAAVTKYDFLAHNQTLGADEGLTTIIASNEDGILLDCGFEVDTSKSVTINQIKVKLLAFNSVENKSFDLDEYLFSIGDPEFLNGSQVIEIDTERGYSLKVGSQFNLAKITTGDKVGDLQKYTLQIGQKISWQDWILNSEVDNVFFDASKPNNNLNEKASNYSGLNGYVIKMALVLNVTGQDDLGREVTGDFINYGGDITVNDYDESSDGVNGVIRTFDFETGNFLGGDILYNGKDTLFKAIFQNAIGMDYAIHRIEPSQNPGDSILELSSLRPSIVNNLLKPLPGEVGLKFTSTPTELITECLIDGKAIQENLQYKLSARVGAKGFNPADSFILSVNIPSDGDSFTLPLLSSGIYNFAVDWGDGSDDKITVSNQAERIHTFATAGVYEINLNGVIEGWSFKNSTTSDRNKLLEVKQWGGLNGVKFTNDSNSAFVSCINMDVTATDIPNFSLATQLRGFFAGCTSLIYNSSVANWDLSGITNIENLFRNSTFNQNIGAWDVSNVTTMENLFRDNSVFTNGGSADILNWDTGNVINMKSMFDLAVSFDYNIGAWDVTSLLQANLMFSGVKLSTVNYDGILIGWESQLVQDNVIFDGGLSNYTAGGAAETALDNLRDDHNWTITAGGPA